MLKRLARMTTGLALTAMIMAAPVIAEAAPFSDGDVFAAVNYGRVMHFSSKGALLEVLNTGASGITEGMAFDDTGNLYVSNHNANSVTRFSAADPHKPEAFGAFSIKKPEGMFFDTAGDYYVGSGCCGTIIKATATGSTVHTLNTGRRADWIQLSHDGTKIYYTEDAHNGVKTIDIATNRLVAPFSKREGFAAFRLLPDGGIIVTHKGVIKRLNATGKAVQVYNIPGVDKWFALNLDSDGTSFWAGSVANDRLYKFDIASGANTQLIDPGTGGNNLFGIAVYGRYGTGTAYPELALMSTQSNAALRSFSFNGNGNGDNRPVPEPGTFSLIALGSIVFLKRREKH